MAGEDDQVSVNITGNSGGLQDAIDQSVGSFSTLAEAVARNGEMIVGALGPIQDMLAALVGSLADAGAQGQAAGEQLGEGLQAGAEEGASSLTLLQAAAMAGSEALSGLSSVLSEMGITGGGGILDMFGNAVEGVTGHLESFLTQMWAVTGGMAMFQVFNDATQWVENFASGLIDLNTTMEKTQIGWGYMFGHMVNGTDTSKSVSEPGASVSQGLADWTKKYSMQMPFTRQDMLQAVTMLAPMGLSEQGVEHFMPVLADLTATYGSAKGLSLTQAAQAVMGANFGLTRMLRYDLMINPQQLVKYGLQVQGSGMGERITNPQTLLPALEAFAKAQGLTGAADYAATNTMWGLQSSWTDRLQNFQLEAGQGLFQGLKGDLKDLSEWWDAHQADMDNLAQVLGKDLALGVHDATLAFQGFFDGLRNSALGQEAMQGMANASKWLTDPKTQTEIKQLGETIGQDLGDTIKHISDTLKDIKTAADEAGAGLSSFGTGMNKIGINLDPWKLLDAIILNIGRSLGDAGRELGDFARILADLKDNNMVQLGVDLKQLAQDMAQTSADIVKNTQDIVNATVTVTPGSGPEHADVPTSTKGPHPKNTPKGEHWVKGPDGYWVLVPNVPGVPDAPPGRGSTDSLSIGGQVSTVASALAGFTSSNPLPVHIQSVSAGATTTYGASYSTQYGNMQQVNNIFGMVGYQLEQLVAGLDARQENANWAAQHVAGLAGQVFGAIGGLL